MKFPFLSQKDNNKIQMVEVDKITPNPYQPRTEFKKEDIKELAESIDNFGMIQPLTLRKKGGRYELIAGERRLRAAKYIKLDKVPCIVSDFTDEEIAEVALVENLQRKDLDFIEESMAYDKLVNKFDLTQKELAEKLGKSQSTIANKLRLLNLSNKVIKKLKHPSISERHARALLKLTDVSEQIEVINKIINEELTVRETQKYIDKIINKRDENKSRKRKTVYKDLRIFKNSLNKTIKEMKEAGLEVKVEQEKDEKFIKYSIFLPRKNDS
ncbi:MAG: nucleoid occlusion protein [Bacillota bacterium]